MNFIQRIWAARSSNSWQKANSEFIKKFITGSDVDDFTSDINPTGNGSLKFNALFACLRVIGETFASVPVFEYKKVDEKTREKTNDTGLYDILHNSPNDEMSAFSFKEMGAYQINLGGNLVSKIQLTRWGEVRGLYPYEWDRVTIDREETSNRKIVYKIDNGRTADPTILQRKDVFHVPGPSLNGIVGMSPIQYAVSSIQLGMTYEAMENRLFKNGTYPTGVFEHPGHLEDKAYERLREQLTQKWTGPGNFGRPLLIEDGLKFTGLKVNLADLQMIENRRFSAEDICRIYRVPPHLIQDLSRSTNNNIEHQSLEFVMYTMLPWFKRWEECINCQLLTRQHRDDGYYYEYNIATLLRGDQKSMAEAFAMGIQWGWLCPNDVRRMLNMNPVKGGDTYLQPLNMVPLGTKPDSTADNYKRILDSVVELIETRGA